MLKKNFLTAQFDMGILFNSKKSDDELEKIFSQLLNIKLFNGTKKIVRRTKKKPLTRCVLTSDDNKYKLIITNKDLSITFYNEELDREVRSNFRVVMDTLTDIYPRLGSDVPKRMRFRHLIFSISKKDKRIILGAYFMPSISDSVENVSFIYNFADDQFEDIVVEENLKIMSDNVHTLQMHDSFSRKYGKEKTFAPITLYHIRGFEAKLTLENIKSYFDSRLEDEVGMTVLDRLNDER